MLPVLPASSPITQDALCAQFIGNLNHTLTPDATLSLCFVISYTPVPVLSTRHSRHRTTLSKKKKRFGQHVLERRSSFARNNKGAQLTRVTVNLMFIEPYIIAIADEWKTNLMTSSWSFIRQIIWCYCNLEYTAVKSGKYLHSGVTYCLHFQC